MKKRVREKIGLTALNIFFIVLCFVTLIPILYALSVSFSGTNSLLSSDFSFIPKDFTLANYAEVFTGEDIMTWFGNSILLAAATVAISLAVSVPAAYCFSRRRFPGRRLVLRWLVLLNSFPAILSMFAVYRLLQPMGLINHRLGLIIVYTGTMAVFLALEHEGLLRHHTRGHRGGRAHRRGDRRPGRDAHRHAARQAQRDSHRPDGAHLCLERVHLRHDLHDRRGELHPRRRLYALQATEMSGSWPVFAAASIVVSLPVLIIFFLCQKHMTSGLTAGGVKG